MERSSGPLRGREREVAALDAMAAQPPHGGRAISIVGEAGIGKSRLWTHGVQAQRAAGRRVLTAICAETEAEMPYSALDQLLEGLLDEYGQELPDLQRHALDRALLRSVGTGPVDTRTVMAGTLGLLRAVCSRQPLVLALDDVQWSDVESERALAHAVRRLEGVGVVLLLARRDRAPLVGGPPVGAADGTLPSTVAHSETLHVGPLGVADARAMLEDRHAARPQWAETSALVDATGGNPMWLNEFALVRARSGRRGAGAMVPESLTAAIRARLDRLQPQVVTAASVVAILGRPHLSAVHRALADELGSASSAGEQVLDDAVGAGLVEFVDGRLVPAHPLIGTALREALPPFRRRRWYRRAAELSESAEERAGFLFAADRLPGDGGDDPHIHDGDACDVPLLVALDEAARSAQGRGAGLQAARFADQAFTLDRSLHTSASAARAIRLAEASARVGDFNSAGAALDGLDLAVLDDDLFERAVFTLADVVPLTDGQRALGALLSRLETYEASSARRRAVVATVRIDHELFRPDHARTVEHALCQRGALSPAGRSRTLGRAVVAGLNAGRPVQDLLAEMEGLAAELPQLLLMSTAVGLRGLVAYAAGEIDRAREAFERTWTERDEVGDDYGVLTAMVGTAVVAFAAGQPLETRRILDRVDDTVRDVYPDASVHLSLRVMILLGENDPAGAEALVARTRVDSWTPGTGLRLLLGLIARERGEPHEAAEHLAAFLDECDTLGVVDPNLRLLADIDLAEVALELGDLVRVARVADRLGDVAATSGRAATAAQAQRLRALLALEERTSEGDARALGLAEAAVEQHAQEARPGESGRSLGALARVLRRLERVGEAYEREEEARRVLTAAGLEHLARRVGPQVPRTGIEEVLTTAERDVAELVAAGHANRTVAEKLGVSVRTVENHLQRLYRKLGIRSRRDLASVLPGAR